MSWAALAGAQCSSPSAGVAATGFVWLAILRRLGVHTRARWVGVFFQSQLAKYIPGTVWQYASRTAAARVAEIPLRPIAKSLPIELLASRCAAGAVSLLLLGRVGMLLLVAALSPFAVARIRRLRVRAFARWGSLRATASAFGTAFLLYAAVWLVVGCGFWLCAHALVNAPASDLGFDIGAFAAAWLVGLLAIYAPGGLGVRETLLVLLLRSRIGAADALITAAAFRAVLTGVDLGWGMVGLLISRRARTGLHPTASPASVRDAVSRP